MNHNGCDSMSDNNKMPEGWGNNKGVPESWGKNNKLPENWGNQNSKVKITSSIPENNRDVKEELEMLSNVAKSGAKILNKAARKAGGTVKNAAGSAVEYVNSDETKEKLNAVKDKAKFIADVAECAVSDIKEKTSDKINKLRLPKSQATVSDNNVSDESNVKDMYEEAISDIKYKDNFSAPEISSSTDTENEELCKDNYEVNAASIYDSSADDLSEDINTDIEETAIAENIEETESTESFDELYEKAIHNDEDVIKNENSSLENSTFEENLNTETSIPNGNCQDNKKYIDNTDSMEISDNALNLIENYTSGSGRILLSEEAFELDAKISQIKKEMSLKEYELKNTSALGTKKKELKNAIDNYNQILSNGIRELHSVNVSDVLKSCSSEGIIGETISYGSLNSNFIEWTIIENKGNSITMLSNDIIFNSPFDLSDNPRVIFKNSYIYQMIKNPEFMTKFFSLEEAVHITELTLPKTKDVAKVKNPDLNESYWILSVSNNVDETPLAMNVFGNIIGENISKNLGVRLMVTISPDVNYDIIKVYEEQENNPKKEKLNSKKILKFAGITAAVIALIAGCVYDGSKLVHELSHNSSSEEDDNNAIVTEQNIISSESQLTKENKQTAQTSPIETTTFVSTKTEIQSTISAEEIEAAKNNIISAFKNSNHNISSFNAISDYDINGDNIPEVIISYMGISGDDHYNIYYYDGTQYVELKECWGELEISETNHIIHEKHYGGGEVSCYYEISSDYKINKIDELSSSPVQNNYSYYRNGRQIDSSEYYAAIHYYSDMNWISIASDFMNNVDSSKPIEQPVKEAVNLEGVINSKGAKYVYSYTTEYVLYGGKKVEQRLDLKNGWHVSAKYSCSAYGLIWYELWDSDDGDYYGWVDSDFIDFNFKYQTAETQQPDISSKYTLYDTSAAGPDFYFYADIGKPASYGRVVNTESDSLNLRAAPSTSADIIMKIPKGATVGEFGTNNVWCYIVYIVDDKSYFGYAASEYLK